MAAGSPCTHLLLLFLLPCFLTALPTAQDDLLINTKNGKVQGKMLSVLGGDVRAFLGIPYAKPPLRKLRFRPPEPVANWQGVRDATKFPDSCYQLQDTTFPGTDTCLQEWIRWCCGVVYMFCQLLQWDSIIMNSILTAFLASKKAFYQNVQCIEHGCDRCRSPNSKEKPKLRNFEQSSLLSDCSE